MAKTARMLFLFLTVCFAPSLLAARHAVIIQLRSGTPELENETAAIVAGLDEYLKNNGVPVRQTSSPDEIRKAFQELAAETAADDEIAVYIFGYASVNARRISLSTEKGRMPAAELAALLDPLKAGLSLYLFNSGSAALFALLAQEGRTVVSACDDPGQLGPPRYPLFYLEALKTLGPDATLGDVLKKAGELTEHFYRHNSLAVAENSQYYHNGEKSSYPFDGSKLAFSTAAAAKPSAEGTSLADLKSKLEKEALKIHPATPATLKTLADAKLQAAPYADYPALFLYREASYILNPDKSAAATFTNVYYINSKHGAEMVSPGAVALYGLFSAGIIYPDGSFCEIARGSIPTPPPGSILTLKQKKSIARPNHLPEFQETFTIQTSLPVCSFKISFPAALKYKFYNVPGKLDTSDDGKLVTVSGGTPVDAYEPLPYDAYPAHIPARLVLTTLQSWEDFLAWTGRLTDRSAELDDDARAFLAELVKGADGELAKVRRIYDYLNSIRYVTTPLGAAAFRPQTPGDVIRNSYGDCKDKANALYAMCRELGIEAERVLVNRGKLLDMAFPSWQFNHMIVYLPKHRLWLDATDNLAPFGDLPPGDAGTTGLMLRTDGVRSGDIPAARPGLTSYTIRVSAANIATIELENTGLFDYNWQRMLLSTQTPAMRRHRLEALVDSLLPGSELLSWELEPAIILKAGYNGGLPTVPEALAKPFLPSVRKHPVRLFDGRKSDFRWSIIFEKKEFVEHKWSRIDHTHAVSLHARGNRVDFHFALLPEGTVLHGNYPKIRGDIYELYRQINHIKEREQQ